MIWICGLSPPIFGNNSVLRKCFCITSASKLSVCSADISRKQRENCQTAGDCGIQVRQDESGPKKLASEIHFQIAIVILSRLFLNGIPKQRHNHIFILSTNEDLLHLEEHLFFQPRKRTEPRSWGLWFSAGLLSPEDQPPGGVAVETELPVWMWQLARAQPLPTICGRGSQDRRQYG